MRRFLAWTVILITLASLILLKLTGSDAAGCLQLLDPASGNILTVDANTGLSHLDARANFPALDFGVYPSFTNRTSPDQRYIVDKIYQSGGRLFKLALGLRSVTKRRLLNQVSFLTSEIAWSPDSQRLAFIEQRDRDSSDTNLVIATASGFVLKREAVPHLSDADWYADTAHIDHRFLWSPDGLILALPHSTQSDGSTLTLYSVQTSPASLSFPDQTIERVEWSPTSAHLLVLTADSAVAPADATPHAYIVSRTAASLTPLTLLAGFAPSLAPTRTFTDDQRGSQRWSPDGNYFYLTNRDQLAVFDLSGNQLAPAIADTMPILWSALPHTLLYLSRPATSQTLIAFDAGTQQATALVTSLPDESHLWLAPDLSVLVAASLSAQDELTFHVISLDLTEQTTPFGAIANRDTSYPTWSPDGQTFTLVAETASAFILMWWSSATDAVQRLQLAKQGWPDEQVSAAWLNTDHIIFGHYGQRENGYFTTALLTNVRSIQATSLFTYASQDDAANDGHIWNDANYLVENNATSINVYRLRDGQRLFSVTPPIEGTLLPFVAPPGNAMLLYRGLYSGESPHQLYLVTDHGSASASYTATNILTADHITLPVWSPRGDAFAVGVADQNGANWELPIVSRDGIVLKNFNLPPSDQLSEDVQMRWTGCS